MVAEPPDRVSVKDRDTPDRDQVSYAGVLKRNEARDKIWADEVEREENWTRAGRRKGTAGADGVQVPREKAAEDGEEDRDREWLQEMRRRSARVRSVIFKKANMDADKVDKEKVEKWLEIELKRKVEVEDLRREGEDKIVVRMKRAEDARELVQRRNEIGERWEMWLDRDRTFRERKSRWLVKERAKEERRMGKKVTEEEGRICVDGTWWVWKEKEEVWAEEKKYNRRQRLARWRQSLERRMEEMKKEKAELEEEEREVQAEEEAERYAEGGKGTAEVDAEANGNTDKDKDVGTATDENTEVAEEVDKAGNGDIRDGKSPENREGTPDRGGPVEDRRETEGRREGAQTNRERRISSDQADKIGHRKEKGARRRERVKKWREDFERRKAEIEKELEELEAEEAEEAEEIDEEDRIKRGEGE